MAVVWSVRKSEKEKRRRQINMWDVYIFVQAQNDFPLCVDQGKKEMSVFLGLILSLWSLCLSPPPLSLLQYHLNNFWCTCKCKFKAVSSFPLFIHLIEGRLQLPWFPQWGQCSVMHTETTKLVGGSCFHSFLSVCLLVLWYNVMRRSSQIYWDKEEMYVAQSIFGGLYTEEANPL